MMKIELYLSDDEQKKLEIVSKRMAREPRKQAFVILMNGLDDFLLGETDQYIKELAELQKSITDSENEFAKYKSIMTPYEISVVGQDIEKRKEIYRNKLMRVANHAA